MADRQGFDNYVAGSSPASPTNCSAPVLGTGGRRFEFCAKIEGGYTVTNILWMLFGGIFLSLCAGISLLLLTDPTYSQEEIDWCELYRPDMTLEVCAEEFGY